MINYADRHKFKEDSVRKDFWLVYEDSNGKKQKIENKHLYQGEFELTESLCSEKELRFGACESGSIKFKIDNGGRESLVGKKLEAYIFLDGDMQNPFFLGTYYVEKDKETADRSAREVIAYDSMKQLIGHDIASWYNKFVKNNPNATIRDIRDAFFLQSWVKKLDVVQAEITLPNDTVPVKNSIQAEQFSSLDFLRSVCEINGVFGHINRYNEFVYIALPNIGEGLYPAENLYPKTSGLYPMDSGASESIGKSHYIKCEYESYECYPIDGIQIRKEEGDIGGAYPTNTDYENGYVIEDNFFAYGFTTAELNKMCTRLKDNIIGKSYRPCKLDIIGDPTLEVGDGIRVVSEREIFITFILERTMKGIQALKDTYTSKGVEKYGSKANSWQTSIIQLKNKVNILKRTSDEFSLKIEDLEKADAELRLTATDFSVRLNGSSQVVDERIDTSDPNSASYDIKYRGIATPVSGNSDKSKNNVANPSDKEYYLNKTNRKLYQYSATDKAWSYVKTLPLIAQSLSSKFAMTDKEISAKVTADTSSNTSFGWKMTSTQFLLLANNKNAFKCTKDGVTVYSNGTSVLESNSNGLTVKGIVNATTGTFGYGNNRKWTIGSYEYDIKDSSGKVTGKGQGTGLYYSKTSFDSEKTGVYIGTNGIALGATSKYDDQNTYSAFQVTSSGALHCNNADIKGKITATSGSFTGTVNATSGSFTGNVTCTSLTLGNGVTLTNSMFADKSISGGKLVDSSVSGSKVVSLTAGKVTSGVINNKTVEWQEKYDIEYIETKTIWQNVGGYLMASAPSSGGSVFGYAIKLVHRNKKLQLVYSEKESADSAIAMLGE